MDFHLYLLYIYFIYTYLSIAYHCIAYNCIVYAVLHIIVLHIIVLHILDCISFYKYYIILKIKENNAKTYNNNITKHIPCNKTYNKSYPNHVNKLNYKNIHSSVKLMQSHNTQEH